MPTYSVAQILQDMSDPWELPRQPGGPFGSGSGAHGVILQANLSTPGEASYSNAYAWILSTSRWRRALPWIACFPGPNFYNNGTWLVEMWNYNAQVFLNSANQWVKFNGAPTSDFRLANYNNGGETARYFRNDTNRYAFDMPDLYTYTVHNNTLFQDWPIGIETDFVSQHNYFDFRLVPRTIGGAVDLAGTNFCVQCGSDWYPLTDAGDLDPAIYAGFTVGFMMSTGRRPTLTERRLHATHVRPLAGVQEERPWLNDSLAAIWPQSEAWLYAHPPLGDSGSPAPTPSPSPSPSPPPPPPPPPAPAPTLTYNANPGDWRASSQWAPEVAAPAPSPSPFPAPPPLPSGPPPSPPPTTPAPAPTNTPIAWGGPLVWSGSRRRR